MNVFFLMVAGAVCYFLVVIAIGRTIQIQDMKTEEMIRQIKPGDTDD